MDPKKRASGGLEDLSLQATRKVDSMSTLAAESLLEQVDGVDSSGAYADAAAIEISRLIEVRSAPPRSFPSSPSIPPPASIRSRGRTITLLVLGALLLVAASVTTTLLVVR